MKITKHMQSCFLIETDYTKILIDPGKFVFSEEGKAPADFTGIDLIIVTHEHTDHFDWENLQRIIESNQPVVLSTIAVHQIVKEKYPNLDCRVISRGFKHKIDKIEIEGFISKHGPLPNGNPAPNVSGVVINDRETKFYTPGDTIELNKEVEADIVAVPICGQVVMDILKAKDELLRLNPKMAIPIHYDNPKYPVDVNDFAKAMNGTGVEVKILKNGESIEV